MKTTEQANGPFIVTTTEGRDAYEARRAGDPGAYRNQGVVKRAVGTLEDARELVQHIVLGVNAPGTGLRASAARRLHPDALQVVWLQLKENASRLPETGGTVGPLPDGTVIEVEPVNSWDLANIVGGGGDLTEIIAAYNAQEAP